MKYLLPLALLALLPGCLNWPPNHRAATNVELHAIQILRDQYTLDGLDPGSCEVFRDVYISENPQSVTEGLCGRRAGSGGVACVYVVNTDIGDIPGSVLIHVSTGAGWRSHHSLVMHEANHVLNSCAGLHKGNYDHSNETWRGHAPGEIGTEGRAWETFDLFYPAPDPDPYASSRVRDAGQHD